MNQEVLAEVAPTIICDASLGKMLDNLELDVDYFTALMRNEGMSDTDIEATVLFLSADSEITKEEETGLHRIRLGEYIKEAKAVKLNIGTYVDVIKYEASNPNFGKIPDDEDVDSRISLKMSEIALHETSHRIDDALMGSNEVTLEDLEYLRQFVKGNYPRRILRRMMILTRLPELAVKAKLQEIDDLLEVKENIGHEDYRNSPAEIRARRKEEGVDNGEGYPLEITLKR